MDSHSGSDKITQYLSSSLLIQFSTDEQGVSPDSNLFETGLMDSFSFLKLIGFIEKEFSIKVSHGEMLSDQMNSLAKIQAFVAAKLAKQSR